MSFGSWGYSVNFRTLESLATLVSGMLFGYGLAFSTMIRPESVLSFLQFDDFGLLLVLGAAVTMNTLVFWIVPRFRVRPLFSEKFQTRSFTANRRSLTGGVLFGIGWGLCGVCPGPALAGIGAGSVDLLVALAGIFVGALLHGLWESREKRD